MYSTISTIISLVIFFAFLGLAIRYNKPAIFALGHTLVNFVMSLVQSSMVATYNIWDGDRLYRMAIFGLISFIITYAIFWVVNWLVRSRKQARSVD